VMFDSLKNLFTKKELSPKEVATTKGEPWVNILKVDLDPANPGQGSFELDWNEHFINWLKRSGFQGSSDEAIVDQWFQTVCHYVAIETWEQYDPNQPRVQRRRVDDKRSEYR